MKRIMMFVLATVVPSVVALAQQAVLYVGSDWSAASKPLQAVWESDDFVASVDVPLAVVDLPEQVTDEVKATWEKQKSIRWELQAVPGFAYFDAKGRCVLLKQHLPAVGGKQARRLFNALIQKGKARAKQIDALLEAKTADGAGVALSIMIPELGIRWSKDPHGMKAAWDILAEVDKDDATGWKFALEFNPMEVCYKVQDLRKKSEAEAEAFIKELEAKPQEHLSVNQKQGIKMLRAVPLKKTAEENAILKEVEAMDATTHFGLAAQGLLAQRGEGDISVPYGWFPKDVPGATEAGKPLVWEISVGVPKVIREPGRFQLSLGREKGQGDLIVDHLMVGDHIYDVRETLAVGKSIDIPFDVKDAENVVLQLAVTFDNPNNEERGTLTLKPILPERVGTVTPAKRAPWLESTKVVVANYARLVIPSETFEAIAAKPKGNRFLKKFFDDKEWMESFFASGKPAKDWATSLMALDTIAYYESLNTAWKRRLATAAALNVKSEDVTEMVRLFHAMVEHYNMKQLSLKFETYRVDQLRYIMLPQQLTADDARWLVKRHNVPSRMYGGVCWHAPYRTYNYFGDSVQGSDYYRAWDHAYLRHERSNLVGAVCGGLSYYGSAATKAHGIPSTPGGQPAHCAYALWVESENRWGLAYNVNPYTWTHFDAWEGAYHYSYLDLQTEACASEGYRASMRAYWEAELLHAKKHPVPLRSPMTCKAYAWTKRHLPKPEDLANLESLGEWDGVRSFNIDQARPHHVYYVWTGTYEVAQDMEVVVRVRSDDGAALSLDGKWIAGKDGVHGMEGSEEKLLLTAGSHTFELRYFNMDGGRGLEVTVAPPEHYDAGLAIAYRSALAKCPLNLPVWKAYGAWLASCEDTTLDAWNTYGDELAQGLAHHVEPAWILLRDIAIPQVKRLGGKDALTAALVRWNGVLRQGDQKTDEFCDYNRYLAMQAKELDNDPEALFKVFTSALSAQYGTRDAFGRLMRWGGDAFMKDDAMAKRYVAALNTLLEEKGSEANALEKYIAEAIIAASNAENLDAFHALCDLQETLKPTSREPFNFDGITDQPLLSKDGLLMLSSTSNWDHPEAYRHVIDDKKGSDMFHTGGEKNPWAEVRLPGMAEVSAVYLDNSAGANMWRLIPCTVEVSEDGKEWTTVATLDKVESQYKLTFPAVKAQRVRVTVRPTDDANRFLHLRKFGVFGKKLY